MFISSINRLSRLFFLVAVAAFLLATSGTTSAEAGNWRVSPIKVYFDVRNRSEVVTVTNEGDQNLALEVTAMEWTQNQNGQDVYRPATDLIFFPKKLTIEAKKDRVIRTGIKVPAVKSEKTYRLFIREIPESRQEGSNAVAIAIQFGVPVFVKPPEEETKGAIIDAAVTNGTFSTKVANQGNSHFRISAIELRGTSVTGDVIYSEDVSGWYLLNGSSRTFTAPIPMAACQQLEALDILVKADRLKLNGQINVDKAMCSVP